MAKRMGAHVRKVASSHAAMVSHPGDVADLIVSAESIGKSGGPAPVLPDGPPSVPEETECLTMKL